MRCSRYPPVSICIPVAHSLAVLRIGSMEVGALLNDAYKEFEVCSNL